MSPNDGMQPQHGRRRRCSQRAKPQAHDSAADAVPMNQHLVPRLQRCFWRLGMSSQRIARREKLPVLVVEELLRRNSVPIGPTPAVMPLRRAA